MSYTTSTTQSPFLNINAPMLSKETSCTRVSVDRGRNQYQNYCLGFLVLAILQCTQSSLLIIRARIKNPRKPFQINHYSEEPNARDYYRGLNNSNTILGFLSISIV